MMTQMITPTRPATADTHQRDRERALAYAATNVDRYERELGEAPSDTECQRAHRQILQGQISDWQRQLDRLLTLAGVAGMRSTSQ